MSEKKKRIVITGMGLVSCFGSDPEKFYERLCAGESGVKEITEFQVDDMPTRFAAWVDDFHPETHVDRKQLRRADPYINYTLYAGKRALESAGLAGDELEKLNKNRCGVIVGSGMGGMQKYQEGVVTLWEKGYRRVSPFFVPYIITNMGGALLGQEVGFMGPNYSISTACATATYSIIAAADHLQKGECDLMICGGVEATQQRITLAGFVACHALSKRNDDIKKASRPWDVDRDGFVLGDGAGIFVMETLEHALARGAPILAEYVGGGTSCDAYHMTSLRPDGSGIALAINKATEGIDKKRINYINAHATSTPAGDMGEVTGIKLALGDQCKKIKMNGTKSMTGHALGGAGGIETVATIMALKTKKLHPTINLENPEPDLDMDVCANEAVDHPEIDVALKNSFGFGGHNACIALTSYAGE